MRCWRRSQVLGLAAVALTVGTALTTVGVVRAGAGPADRVSVIELEEPAATTAPSGAPPRPSGAGRVVPPAPVPAGPAEDAADDGADDGADAHRAGGDDLGHDADDADDASDDGSVD